MLDYVTKQDSAPGILAMGSCSGLLGLMLSSANSLMIVERGVLAIIPELGLPVVTIVLIVLVILVVYVCSGVGV